MEAIPAPPIRIRSIRVILLKRNPIVAPARATIPISEVMMARTTTSVDPTKSNAGL